MNVCFVNVTDRLMGGSQHPNHDLAPLDIGYCASILDELGHNTFFIETGTKDWDTNKIKSFIIKNKINICVFKVKHDLSRIVLFISGEIKLFVDKIFVFGSFPSLSPKSFIFKESPIDICIIGEPEVTIKELFDNKKNKSKIRGIAYYSKKFIKNGDRGLLKNLDNLPLPKHVFFIDKNYRFYYPTHLKEKLRIGYILSSRGCPFRCSFCSIIERVSQGKHFVGRSPVSVVDEIEFLVRKGVNFIYFEDDIFTCDMSRVEEICDEILRRNVKVGWAIQSRVDMLNQKIIKKLRLAGCSTICLGIETINEELLVKINKGLNKSKIIECCKWCKLAGIKIVGFFMIGLPGETKELIREDIKFAKRITPDMITISFYTPYVGSKDYNGESNASQRYHGFPHQSYSKLHVNDLIKLQKFFYKSFYLDPVFLFSFFRNEFFYILKNFNMEKELFIKTIRFLFF